MKTTARSTTPSTVRPTHRRARLVASTAVALAASVTLAACGSDDDATSADGGGDELTSVRVNVSPVGDQVPVWMADDLGYYEEEGLEVDVNIGAGGAEFIPALLSGDIDFALVNPTTLYVALDQGLEVVVVSGMSESRGTEGEDLAAILVAGDSDIETAADLEGRSVAVNTLNSILLTTGRESIRQADGDPDAAEYVEIGLPDQLAQLEAGNVDAMVGVEPFVTQAIDAGARAIAWPFVDAAPNLTTSVVVTTPEMIEEQPEVVDGFVAALSRASDYAMENTDEARATMSNFTDIEADLLARLVLPVWTTEINRDSALALAELQLEDGLISELPDIDAILP